jgi:hypothetical protein
VVLQLNAKLQFFFTYPYLFLTFLSFAIKKIFAVVYHFGSVPYCTCGKEKREKNLFSRYYGGKYLNNKRVFCSVFYFWIREMG